MTVDAHLGKNVGTHPVLMVDTHADVNPGTRFADCHTRSQADYDTRSEVDYDTRSEADSDTRLGADYDTHPKADTAELRALLISYYCMKY